MNTTKAWYVLYLASPLCETPLLRAFKNNGTEIEWWYPKAPASRQLKKRVVPIMRPVFATYAFINCSYTPDLEDVVQKVAGCYFVPGASQNLIPISDEEMDEFKDAVKTQITSGSPSGQLVALHSEVEIISGSMAGYKATVKASFKDKLIVELECFGRSVPVTLKYSEITAL